jgi:hypothetical protein
VRARRLLRPAVATFVAACLGGIAWPALLVTPAAAAGPALTSARIDARAAGQGTTTVTEVITVVGLEATAPIDNTLLALPGVQVDGMRVAVGGRQTEGSLTGAGTVRHLRVSGGAAGVSYAVSYTVHDQASSFRVPLLVPVATPPGSPVVHLSYQLPDGQYLQGDSFPVVSADHGTVTRDMAGVPSFLHFQYGPSPAGPLTIYNLVTALVAAVIVVLTLVWIVTERRALRRGGSGV